VLTREVVLEVADPLLATLVAPAPPDADALGVVDALWPLPVAICAPVLPRFGLTGPTPTDEEPAPPSVGGTIEPVPGVPECVVDGVEPRELVPLSEFEPLGPMLVPAVFEPLPAGRLWLGDGDDALAEPALGDDDADAAEPDCVGVVESDTPALGLGTGFCDAEPAVVGVVDGAPCAGVPLVGVVTAPASGWAFA
jgi:hypothetical protein